MPMPRNNPGDTVLAAEWNQLADQIDTNTIDIVSIKPKLTAKLFPYLKTTGGAVSSAIQTAWNDDLINVGDVIQTASYWQNSNFGGCVYRVVAPATGVQDGGAFISFTGFQLQAVFDAWIDVTWFGANGGASDLAAMNAAIAYVNNNGTNGTGNGRGWTLSLTSKAAWSFTEALDPIAVDGVTVRGGGPHATTIECDDGSVFTVGNLAGYIDTVTLCDFAAYWPNTINDENGQLVKFQHGTRLLLDNIVLHNAPGLVEMNAPTDKYTSDVYMSNIYGSTANVARPVVWSHGAGLSSGLYMQGIRLFPNGVVAPLESTTTAHSAVNGCIFLLVESQFDTIMASDCVINRYHVGIEFRSDASRAIGNCYFTNFIADYQHTAVRYVCTNSSSITNINFEGGWLNSTDGPTIDLPTPSGLLANIVFKNVDFLMSGVENCVIPVGARNVTFDDIRVFGTGRLDDESDGFVVTPGATDVTLNDIVWVDAAPFYGELGIRLPARAIVAEASIFRTRITNCVTRASGAHYAVAGYGINWIVARNRKSDDTRPEYLTTASVTPPASAATYTNESGWAQMIYLRDGTVTAVNVNGVQIASATPCQALLAPGDTLAITYSSTPIMAIHAIGI